MDEGPHENSLAEAIVGTITQPLLVLDADLRVETANRAFMETFQVAPEATEGRMVYELGYGQWDIPELRRLLEDVLTKNDTIEDYRVEHEFKDVGRRVMLLNANRMQRTGTPDTILLAISDVTEREGLIHELEGRKEFSEKLIDSVRESLLILTWDLRVHFANQSYYDQFDTSPDEIQGRPVWELGNGQWDIPELRKLLEDVLPKENAFDDFEVHHEFENLGRRIMLLNGRRLDHLDLIILAIRDITEKREQEARRQVFIGELQHRVRNILHNVSVLASHTRRSSSDLDEFMDAFVARLEALARAQDMLLESPSEAVALDAILRLELGAVGAEEGREFTLDGPAVKLPPKDAQTIAMAAHELTTNAAKHGALKAEPGRIEIAWQLQRQGDERQVSLRWRERGVEIAETGARKGFGSQVIEQSLPHMLGGTAEMIFHRDGLECRIEFPLPRQIRGKASSGGRRDSRPAAPPSAADGPVGANCGDTKRN